jgi:TolB-like protein/predicted Ser/Thr protein kinase
VKNLLHYSSETMSGRSIMMATVTRTCAKCGAKIFAEAPQEFCSACFLKTGLALLAEEVQTSNVQRPTSNAEFRGEGHAPKPARMVADFGDYELLEEIGRGGQGLVYRARQKSLNRTVALKVIGLGQWATEEDLKRFRREAEAAASLDHPCIVPIHEVGEREGCCYFSMNLVEGSQLDEVVKREPMPLRRAAELIAKLARAVHYAHEHGILHRDIKPGNVLLDRKGEPHLTDFGLARVAETESTVTRTMEVLGTPSYMAPEQAVGNNARVSRATDVYGLGAVLYQLLTNHPPFAGGTTYETIKLLLDTDPRQPRLLNPKIDRDLSTICLKCLEKDPKRRYSSALALAEDLERWLKHEPIQARRTGFLARGSKWVRRNPSIAVMAAMLLALAVPLGAMIWKSEFVHRPITTGIAVLPFENLSDEKEHASFADGVQDDILTKLAKVADLKVISRTSVMQYRGKQNVRHIGNALRVSHVLEGTVRRSGGRVHMNAQLIDTRNDTHVWAEEYDRDLNDVFAIETEVAQSIANRLRAKVSAREKIAMQQWPTKDLVAYDLYVRATLLIDKAPYPENEEQRKDYYFQVVELLNQAVAHDPGFLLAYCRLAEAHDELYFFGVDRTPNRLALAKTAIDAAFRIKPDSGEAHLALATHLYLGYLDYDRARDEFAIAVRTLPNNARIFEWSGIVDRRQNRWHDAVRNLERAMELDPRNVRILTDAAVTYWLMRDYGQQKATIDRIIALEPNNIRYRYRRSFLDAWERVDVGAMRAWMEKACNDPAFLRTNAWGAFFTSRLLRKPIAADRALAAITGNDFPARGITVGFTPAYAKGLVARMKGDEDGARATFNAARTEQEKIVHAQPDDFTKSPALCLLGLIDAALGRKQEALGAGRRAVELLLPITKNALDAPDILYFYAAICAQVGERDLAIGQLKTLAQIPAGVHYGELRLDPFWDPLRGDPRFEKIVNSLAPKEVK